MACLYSAFVPPDILVPFNTAPLNFSLPCAPLGACTLQLAELFSLSYAIGLRHVYPSTESHFVQAQAAGGAEAAAAADEAHRDTDLISRATYQPTQQIEESQAESQEAGGRVVQGGREGRVLAGRGGGVREGVSSFANDEDPARLQELIQKELRQMQQQTGIDLIGLPGRQGAAPSSDPAGAAAAGAVAGLDMDGSGGGATNKVAQAHAQFLDMMQGVTVATTVSRLQRTRVGRDDWLAKGVADIDQSENATFVSRSSLLINKFTPGVTAVAQKFLTGSPMGRQLFVDGEATCAGRHLQSSSFHWCITISALKPCSGQLQCKKVHTLHAQ